MVSSPFGTVIVAVPVLSALRLPSLSTHATLGSEETHSESAAANSLITSPSVIETVSVIVSAEAWKGMHDTISIRHSTTAGIRLILFALIDCITFTYLYILIVSYI